ncbi:MAG TPA: signal peptidase II [Candidatus Angelobacter sp.]|jgi:signal peptidase II|nr:signal peptidase II [Candidatus Angelobacter sp.]
MPKRPLLIALAVLLLDRITKWAIAQTIPLEDAINIIPGFFRLTHLENTGAAFSLFADSPSPFRTTLLIGFSVAALAVISVLLWRDRNVFHSGTLALSLILGGAVGNLWDRVADGKVTDFLDFYIGTHHWPPFNVADSAIVVGALLLFMRMLRKTPHSQVAA